MIPRTFTPDSWAHAASISLPKAILFTDDLVAMGLAEPVDEHRLRLTAAGLKVVLGLRGGD